MSTDKEPVEFTSKVTAKAVDEEALKFDDEEEKEKAKASEKDEEEILNDHIIGEFDD